MAAVVPVVGSVGVDSLHAAQHDARGSPTTVGSVGFDSFHATSSLGVDSFHAATSSLAFRSAGRQPHRSSKAPCGAPCWAPCWAPGWASCWALGSAVGSSVAGLSPAPRAALSTSTSAPDCAPNARTCGERGVVVSTCMQAETAPPTPVPSAVGHAAGLWGVGRCSEHLHAGRDCPPNARTVGGRSRSRAVGSGAL